MYAQRVKTRAEVEEFVTDGNDENLLGVSRFHCESLLEAGKSVCKIEFYDPISEAFTTAGTGFLFGNGWILSNQHVICSENEDTSDCNNIRFVFPERTFERQSRNVIFSCFPDADFLLHEVAPDLAFIRLSDDEISEWGQQGLATFMEIGNRIAANSGPVFLIHYADSSDTPGNPQLFSLGDGVVCFNVSNSENVKYIIHTAHTREGASGSPLLYFRDNVLNVLGVNFGGPLTEWVDSPGYAISYFGEPWIQSTLGVIDFALRAIRFGNLPGGLGVEKALYELNQLNTDLGKSYLKIRIPIQSPIWLLETDLNNINFNVV